MAAVAPNTEGKDVVLLPSRPASTMKAPKVLACIQCQQRKIKCNRDFPCNHCMKSGVQCIPGNAIPKQRKRRFAERELLNRLRDYEQLLKQNNIDFEPLHPSSTATKEEPSPSVDESRNDDDAVESTSATEATPSSSMNFWSAVTQTPATDDEDHHERGSGSDSDFNAREMGESMIKKAWAHSNYRKEDLIFGTPLAVDLSLLHPDPAQVFKFWQVYLDNVDPLLKITHTPTLQPRIIDAVGHLSNVGPALHTLLFAIYCVSIVSLLPEQCWSMFAASKEDLLGRYQFACQQALLQSGFLRSEEMDCLTGLCLYQISMKPDIDARSLASSMGVALRIAQRMGLHDESTYSKYSALDAELRRRLWWALVIFDNRMCEMSNNLKSTMLLPLWDCRPPSNYNDFDLRAETKLAPKPSDIPSQSVFVVVRTQLADFLRNSTWYLDFNNPSLKALINKQQPSLDAFEERIEKYLQKCNPEDPVHFMTIWTARAQFAKNRFWDHLSKHPKPSINQLDTDRDLAVSYALRYLECDTQLLSFPLVKGFEWYTKAYSFFPAYIHIIQDLRKRPLQKHSQKAWEVMSTDWAVRHRFSLEVAGNPFFAMFSRIVFLAWEAREAALTQQGLQLEPYPGIVGEMYQKVPSKQPSSSTASGDLGTPMDLNIDDFLLNLMPMPIDFAAGQQVSYESIP